MFWVYTVQRTQRVMNLYDNTVAHTIMCGLSYLTMINDCSWLCISSTILHSLSLDEWTLPTYERSLLYNSALPRLVFSTSPDCIIFFCAWFTLVCFCVVPCHPGLWPSSKGLSAGPGRATGQTIQVYVHVLCDVHIVTKLPQGIFLRTCPRH